MGAQTRSIAGAGLSTESIPGTLQSCADCKPCTVPGPSLPGALVTSDAPLVGALPVAGREHSVASGLLCPTSLVLVLALLLSAPCGKANLKSDGMIFFFPKCCKWPYLAKRHGGWVGFVFLGFACFFPCIYKR